MTSILSGTRLAFLVGESSKKRSIYEDDVPTEALASSSISKPDPSTIKRARGGNRVLKAAWIISGLLTILLPVLIRNVRMNKDQNDMWDQVANQYNKYQQQYSNQRYYDVNNCKWYSIGCQPMYIDEGGRAVSQYEMQQEKYRQQMERQQQKYQYQAEQQQRNYEYRYQSQANGQPSWYWGQSEQQRSEALESGQATAPLRFVYGWQMIMFLAILAYGYYVIHNQTTPAYLIGALVVWFQFNFLSMIMLSDGSIVTEDRIMELSGFYGQFAVLMFITDAWYGLFGVIFAIYFAVNHYNDTQVDRTKKVEVEEKVGDYQPYEEETIKAPPSPTKSDISEEYVKVV